jgi:hypothetical protein
VFSSSIVIFNQVRFFNFLFNFTRTGWIWKDCVLHLAKSPLKNEFDEDLAGAKVREGRRIASLRIHIECVITCVREIVMISEHTKIKQNILPALDCVAQIPCGLVNLQPRFAV